MDVAADNDWMLGLALLIAVAALLWRRWPGDGAYRATDRDEPAPPVDDAEVPPTRPSPPQQRMD